jgi:photosystem II stability/assembly factor-like uncharacterized protein
MDFVDTANGWVGGTSAGPWATEWMLLHTMDGGSDWKAKRLAEGCWADLVLIDFVDRSVGWACGGDESTYRTKDGGASWVRCRQYVANAHSLAAVSGTEAWLAAGGRLRHTLDGGATWKDVPYPHQGTFDAFAVLFLDRRHGWVACSEKNGGALVLLSTVDGGRTFRQGKAPAVRANYWIPGHVLHFRDRREGWMAFGGSSLLHTVDGGKTWALVGLRVPGQPSGPMAIWDCAFPSQLEGWAVGNDDKGALALRTRDGGKTWERVTTGAEGIYSSKLERVVFVDKDHGWVYGRGGEGECDYPPVKAHEIAFILKYVP